MKGLAKMLDLRYIAVCGMFFDFMLYSLHLRQSAAAFSTVGLRFCFPSSWFCLDEDTAIIAGGIPVPSAPASAFAWQALHLALQGRLASPGFQLSGLGVSMAGAALGAVQGV